jgi:hypothetical protein
MHQWMAAVIDFFALVKGFSVWHARYLRDSGAAFDPLRPRAGVSQLLTRSKRSGEVRAFGATDRLSGKVEVMLRPKRAQKTLRQ